jgi:hypothetical protein
MLEIEVALGSRDKRIVNLSRLPLNLLHCNSSRNLSNVWIDQLNGIGNYKEGRER